MVKYNYFLNLLHIFRNYLEVLVKISLNHTKLLPIVAIRKLLIRTNPETKLKINNKLQETGTYTFSRLSIGIT